MIGGLLFSSRKPGARPINHDGLPKECQVSIAFAGVGKTAKILSMVVWFVHQE
jgi:hypothetical protein